MVALLVIALLFVLFVVFVSFARPLDRSAEEVTEILSTFLQGEPTGHLADDFVHTPIAHPELEEIRRAFEDLLERCPTWRPEQPLPEFIAAEVKLLVERARSLSRAKVGD